MSSKDEIWDLINKKASKIKDIKERTSRNHNYRKIVIEFFKAMDAHYFNAEDASDLKIRYKKEKSLLYSRLRSIHPSVGVNPIWNSQDEDTDWKELQISSVVVTFPPDIAKQLNLPEQECIDMGDILWECLELEDL